MEVSMSRRACSGVSGLSPTADPWWVDEPRHVAADQAPALGGHQCPAQDGVDVLDPARGETRCLLAVEEGLDIGGGELGEGDTTEARDEVAFDQSPGSS